MSAQAAQEAEIDAVLAKYTASLQKEIESLTTQRDRYFDALEKIKALRWGNDGDCGALAIIEEVL